MGPPFEIVCIGGGPSGLLLGILLHRSGAARVTVHERNAPDDTFGFGVVFSDETLANLRSADPEVFGRIEAEFVHWPIMDVVHRGRTLRSAGHGFAALSRKRLLSILGERAVELGVVVHHLSPVRSIDDVALAHADLVVAADGVNSTIRTELADRFGPRLERGRSKYTWFGTTKRFEQFTFLFAETEWGLFQAHVYPYSPTEATFIVETSPEAWTAAGLDTPAGSELAPGESDHGALAFCERIFADALDGHPLLGNNSRWLEFTIVRNATWQARHGERDVVLIGDAAHTAHFSIGSGTKMAFEDAIALADALAAETLAAGTATSSPLAARLATYEAERRPQVESTQRAAVTSQRWFESARRYINLPSEQFAFSLLTRSQRITYDNLFLRDATFAREILGWFHASRPEELHPSGSDGSSTPPMFHPFQLRSLRLANRIVVSPMAQYCAVDGMPGDWHLVHLGSRAVGGAALVMTEMTCVSPEGRITPGCTGLWSSEQAGAWRRVTDFVHEHSEAHIGLQLGHSGRKGSTRVAWEGMDLPLPHGNWELLGPSAIGYQPGNVVPREMSRADMDAVLEQFVRSTELGHDAGFDLLEIHAAHGYLLSSFLSPVTNRRTDDYGGSLEARMRFPLEVVSAVRSSWPDQLPLSVRISATDWMTGGFTGDDAVVLARALKAAGCDIVDVSTGQVDPDDDPEHGRLFQAPYADRIRHEAGIATMAVGAIASVDDVNTLILAGRADLCLLARPHLVDPYWTLNAAIDQRYDGHPWPVQYLSGHTARRRDQRP